MLECAFSREGSCAALTTKKCARCSFFKTDVQLRKGRAKAMHRINELPPEHRKVIYDKYYGKHYNKREFRINEGEED